MAEPSRVAVSRAGARSLRLAIAAVAIVLGLSIVTSLLPTGAQEIVFHTPLAIIVLLVGTGWLLWRIGRRPPER